MTRFKCPFCGHEHYSLTEIVRFANLTGLPEDTESDWDNDMDLDFTGIAKCLGCDKTWSSGECVEALQREMVKEGVVE